MKPIADGAYVDDGGLRWHVRTTGSGPVLLAVHGTGSSGASFARLTPLLAERFTVIAPDLPGHARTGAVRELHASLPAFARALGSLCAKLDVKPALALGHSAGAAVIARAILDRGLAPRLFVGLGAAMLPLPPVLKSVFTRSAGLLARSPTAQWIASLGGREYVDRVLHGVGSALDAESAEHYRSLAARPEHIAGVAAMLSRWDLEPLYAALPRLEVRTLLIAGAQDRAVPLSSQYRVASRLRSARVAVVPDGGHLVHEERPTQVAQLVLEEWARYGDTSAHA